jgi:hypothetical protein
MATVIDVGLLGFFSPIFALIFIFVVVFGVLTVTKLFGDNKGVVSLIALTVALMTTIAPSALEVIAGMTPFFVIGLVFVVFLLMMAMFLGLKQPEILASLGGNGAFWAVFIFAIVVMFIVLSNVYGSTTLSYTQNSTDTSTTVSSGDGNTGGSDITSNAAKTFFNEKILGMILILFVASFAVRFLSISSK